MKKINFAKTLAAIVLGYFLIYNTYFGWNKTPINEAEKICDTIYSVGWFIVMLFYFLPVLDVYETYISNHEKNKS